MSVVVRLIGALYLTVGCVWAWRWTSVFGSGIWRATRRGLRHTYFAPGPIAPVVATVFWLYDGIAEIVFWPLGVRRELRFRRWLKTAVPPR